MHSSESFSISIHQIRFDLFILDLFILDSFLKYALSRHHHLFVHLFVHPDLLV